MIMELLRCFIPVVSVGGCLVNSFTVLRFHLCGTLSDFTVTFDGFSYL